MSHSVLPRRLGPALLLLLSSVAAGQSGDLYGNGFSDVDSQLGAGQARLEQQQRDKDNAQQRLDGLTPQMEELRGRMHKNARALYRVRRGGMLPVAGGMAALLGHASRVSRLERIVSRDIAELGRLEREAHGLRKQVALLDSNIVASQQAVSGLETARASAVRERATRSSFEAVLSRAPDSSPAQPMPYGLSVVGGAPVERFVEQKGNLALPVSGPSSIQDATRAESDGPGLEFAASGAAAVRAAAAGRVAFADHYGSYGKLVILEHGERFYSVYGGLGAVEVQVGDTLSKSARIGSSGSEPVYFEVRRGTKTQDARSWLGL